MTTVAALAARDHAECGHLFVLQGVPFMLTDREELAGRGPGSYIGEDYGPRRVLMGLDLRGASITYATEMVDGRPDTGDELTFKFVDLDGELVQFFAGQPDRIEVGGRLSPKMVPAPANLVGSSGIDVPIWNKYVNTEALGPAGERSYYSLFPGGDPAGQDHAAYSGAEQSLSPSYVYSSPTHLEGRRCALYRVFYDHDTGTWPSWQDQHDSGESLIWVGSLTNEAKPKHREWSLKAEGPSSWLRKQLAARGERGCGQVAQAIADAKSAHRRDRLTPINCRQIRSRTRQSHRMSVSAATTNEKSAARRP